MIVLPAVGLSVAAAVAPSPPPPAARPAAGSNQGWLSVARHEQPLIKCGCPVPCVAHHSAGGAEARFKQIPCLAAWLIVLRSGGGGGNKRGSAGASDQAPARGDVEKRLYFTCTTSSVALPRNSTALRTLSSSLQPCTGRALHWLGITPCPLENERAARAAAALPVNRDDLWMPSGAVAYTASSGGSGSSDDGRPPAFDRLTRTTRGPAVGG